MKIIKGLVQGSPEWLAHRRTTRNASDAPSIMGVSPHVSRSEFIKQKATGIEREYDERTKAIFARGHAVEPALRAMAERILGEDLFPVTAVSDDDYLGASFDGVTMLEDVIFEAKQPNADKTARMERGEIPPVDYWQIVQQFAVCETAECCLYLVGDGTDENTAKLEISRSQVEHDIPNLRAGWEQIDADVAVYVPEIIKAAPVAAPIARFGALTIRVEGRVLASNLDAFKADAEAFLAALPKTDDLQTDQDFVDADAAVKACMEAEERIDAAVDASMAEMRDVEELRRTATTIRETIRSARLALNNVLEAEKKNRRAKIVADGAKAVREHYDRINATLGEYQIQPAQSLQLDLAAAIKGKKLLSSMQDAVSTAVANAKITASQQADRVRANVAILAEHAEHESLFADRVQLCATKTPEDLRNLVSARINEHKLKEQARLDAEREKIRQEEAARLEREQLQREEENRRAQLAEQIEQTAQAPASHLGNVAPPAAAAQTVAAPVAAGTARIAQTGGVRIRIGEINDEIGLLKIDADGLAQLGFHPVATAGAAKLYDARHLEQILLAIASHVTAAANRVHDRYQKAA